MGELLNLTPGLQCCLRCRRLLTDRALHDALEEPVLASIRAGHPEWVGSDGVCQPCVREYRSLLSDRQTRSGRQREAVQERKAPSAGGFFERLTGMGRA